MRTVIELVVEGQLVDPSELSKALYEGPVMSSQEILEIKLRDILVNLSQSGRLKCSMKVLDSGTYLISAYVEEIPRVFNSAIKRKK